LNTKFSIKPILSVIIISVSFVLCSKTDRNFTFNFSKKTDSIFILLFFLFIGNISFSQTATFTTGGTATWTCPAGVTTVDVECYGAGGGGARMTSNGRGGGGGGGAYAATTGIAVSTVAAYNIAIGIGGTFGVNGGNSTFNATTVIAAGGNGVATNSTAGGAGGSTGASTGLVKYKGGNGGTSTGSISGAGGGGAGSNGAGGNATGGTAGTGTSNNPDGIGGAGTNDASINGFPGVSYGGGGGGARRNGTSRNGGTGADGAVILTYSCPIYSLTNTSASSGMCGGVTSTVTLTSSAAGLPVGTYTVTYDLSGANTASGQTASMTVSVAGTGTFTTIALANGGTTTVTITMLTSGAVTGGGAGGTCNSIITNNNTADFTVNPTPTITFNTIIYVGNTATTANVPYYATTGSPDHYSITWSAAAITAGFANVTNAVLPATPIVLSIPNKSSASYTGNLTVTNSVTGCTSNTYAITVTYGNYRYSVATNTWANTATWSLTSGGTSGASVPIAGYSVFIEKGYNVTVGAAAACASITFTGTGNPATLTVNNTLTMTSSITLNSLTTADNSCTITGSGTITGGTTIAVGTSITPANGTNTTTFNCSVNTFTISSTLTLLASNSGANYNNPVVNLSQGTLNTSGGVVTSNAAAGNISTFDMSAAISPQTATLNLAGTTSTITLSGTGVNNIYLNGTGGTVQYSGTGTQAILPTTYYNLSCTGTGAGTFSSGCTINGTFTINNASENITLNTSGTTQNVFYINNLNLINGTLDNSNSGMLGVTSILYILNSYTESAGLFTTSGSGYGRMIFSGGGNTTYSNYGTGTTAIYWEDIQVSNNTTLTLNSDLGLNGVVSTAMLTIDAGSTLIAGTYQIISGTAGETWLINGTLKTAKTAGLDGGLTTTLKSTNSPIITLGSASTIVYNSAAGAQTVTAHSDYANLTINNTSGSTSTLAGASTVSGVLYMQNGRLTTTSTNTLSVTNTASNAIQGGSTTSFINGPLTWSLPSLSVSASVYTWPIGQSSNYYPFSLTSLTTTTPVITAEAFNSSTGGGSAGANLTSISGTEYWLATINSGTYIDGSVSITRPSALGVFDVIGQCATKTGAYANIGGTVSGTSINNSGSTGSSLGFFVMAQSSACLDPTIQATPITFTSVSPVQMTVNWASGNGQKSIVLINTVNSFTDPVDGTDPSANPTYSGSGQQCIYNGSSASVTVSGLSPTTTYWFRVYEANCGGSSVHFLTSTALNNPNSQATSAIAYFYNKAASSANLQLTTSWGTTTSGGGSPPANFTTDWQVFVILNGSPATIGGTWTVSGTGSKVIVGNASYPAVTFNIPSGASVFTGTIDVAAASSGTNTLTIGNATIPTLGSLDASSTVNYSLAGDQTITAATYGNLTCSGTSGTKTFANASTITGNFNISEANTVVLNTSTSTYKTFTIGTLNLSSGTLNGCSGNWATTSLTTELDITGGYNQTGGTFTSTGTNAYPLMVFTGGGNTTYKNAYTNSTKFNYTQVQVSNNTTLTLNSDLGTDNTITQANMVTVDLGSTLIAGNYHISADITLRSVLIEGTITTSNTAGLNLGASTTIKNSNSPYLTLGTSSTVVYNSTDDATAQTITAHVDYANVTIDNSSGLDLLLGGNSTMSGTLTLTEGNINLSGYNFTIGTSTSTPGYVSLSSNHGWLYGTGSVSRFFLANTLISDATVSSGLFPLGALVGSVSSYRPLYIGISGISSSNGTITVSHTGASTVSNVNFSDNGVIMYRRQDSYWTLSYSGLTGGTYRISAGGTNFGLINNLNSLRLTKVSSQASGSEGTNTGTTSSPILLRIGISLGNLPNSYYVSSNDPIALPIELIGFDAECTNEKVYVIWATASEINNDYFNIERSTDGSNFQSIAELPGAGFSNNVIHYSCESRVELRN